MIAKRETHCSKAKLLYIYAAALVVAMGCVGSPRGVESPAARAESTERHTEVYTIGQLLGGVEMLSEFAGLVERCGDIKAFNAPNIAPLVPPNSVFEQLDAPARARLRTNAKYCAEVVACQLAGFDCVAASNGGTAKVSTKENAHGNVTRYSLGGVNASVPDVESSNGVLLIADTLTPLPGLLPIARAHTTAVVDIHRRSHAAGFVDGPVRADEVPATQLGGAPTADDEAAKVPLEVALFQSTGLKTFAALLRASGVAIPKEGMVAVVTDADAAKLPKGTIEALRSDKPRLQKVMRCHMDPVRCMLQGSMRIVMVDGAVGMQFGTAILFRTEHPRVMASKAFLSPP